jgi:hypothetical protein
MSTSVNDLKERLRGFLAHPESEHDFRVWLAFALRDAHKASEPGFESFAHSVERAFSETADGVYTADELRSVLAGLAKSEDVLPIPAAPILVERDAGGFWFVKTMAQVSVPEQWNLSQASQVSSASSSGTLVPSFFSVPQPVSVRDEDANFWGIAEPAQRRSAA